MINKDGDINKILALLLEKIECHLLISIKALTDYISREELEPSLINDLRVEHIEALFTDVEPIYQAAFSRNEVFYAQLPADRE